jgi:hypothetical protein
VEQRIEKNAARRSEHGKNDRASKAVDEAQPGQRNADPVHRSASYCTRKHVHSFLLPQPL